MRSSMTPFDEIGMKRIVQLVAKSNQFNLTTIRYSETELNRIMNDESYITLQIRLSDSFGDNGMVSVLISKIDDDKLFIDTWLMSCRVLGRKLEIAVLNYLVSMSKKYGVKEIYGKFIPTERNIIVKNHYSNLGFKILKENKDGETDWILNLKDFKPEKNIPIKVIS